MSSDDARNAEAAAAVPQPEAKRVATETTPLVRPSRVSIAALLLNELPDTPAVPDAEQGGGGGGGHPGEGEEDPESDGEYVHIPAPDAEGATHAVVGGQEGQRRHSSVFRADIEEHIRKADPSMFQWLLSPGGMTFQIGLCVTLVAISAYEAVVKKRALDNPGSNFVSASITTNASIISVLVSLAWAVYMKEFWSIFDRQTFGPRMLRYIIPGCGFQLTSYLQVLALGFIATDVFKVLEQTRLLITALMTMQVFGKKQSIAGWNALVVITLAAISYTETKNLVGKEECLSKVPPDCKKGESKAMTVGLIITAVFVLLQVGCCILCEMVLKDEKKTPFYIQKFFLELPGSIFGLIIANIVNPIMYKILLGDPFNFDPTSESVKPLKGKDGNLFEHFFTPFAGWNFGVWMAFFLFMAKSWCSGFLTKQLSAIVKQLCSTFAVGIIYFLMQVHPKTGPFFYPEGLGSIHQSMVIADFCVLCAVISYTLAGRDKKRKEQFKKEAHTARMERNKVA
mmetsp:Transcript_8543/g.21468  ORF Transcript_8543/g.21468 Transcript_8543/m.21468 type:complete len:511 (-) Transcript_8543:157-1689(-)